MVQKRLTWLLTAKAAAASTSDADDHAIVSEKTFNMVQYGLHTMSSFLSIYYGFEVDIPTLFTSFLNPSNPPTLFQRKLPSDPIE